MNTKHTNGPWYVRGMQTGCDGYNEHRHIYASDRENGNNNTGCVAEVRSSDANARLIAAAPEMLELLQTVAMQLKVWTGPNLEICAKTLSALAEAAIAKATGGSL